MASASETTIRSEGIAHALSDALLAVPLYQRSYAWEERHVLALLQDIQSAIDKKESEYFLGSIVCTKYEGFFEVVDGQQRLATVSILIGAIRDHFLEQNDTDRADDLERTYLVRRDLKTQETHPRLRLNDSDNSYWSRRVLARPKSSERIKIQGTAPAKTSHGRLNRAADLAAEHVRILAKSTSTPSDKLSDLVEFLAKNVRVIWIQAPDDANAFVIFETLNDRGMELAISDLLKNYLFLLAEDRIGEAQQNWVSMIGTLEAVSDDSAVTEFIRHFWSSKKGATRERDLYASLKRGVTSKKAALELAEELAAGARLYVSILNTDHELWKPLGSTARSHMATINLLGMVQVRPLLLAMLSTLPPSEVERALRLIVSWGVRLLISGGLGGGVMEDRYCSAALKVRAGSATTAAAIRKLLSDAIPNDAEFEEKFAAARVSKSALARYYLRALEKQHKGDANPELVPNPNEEQVNLEHVLPESPGANWPQFTEDDARAWSRRLGNQALLSVPENTVAGNAPFGDKRPVLGASQFQLTAMIGKKTRWRSSEIANRQKRLAALAVKTWPLTT